MVKWLIYKHGPRDWRLSRGEKPGYRIKCFTHADAVRTMNLIVRMNSYPPLAA